MELRGFFWKILIIADGSSSFKLASTIIHPNNRKKN